MGKTGEWVAAGVPYADSRPLAQYCYHHTALNPQNLQHITQHHHKSVLTDLETLSENDGHSEWRLQEAKELEELVQKRLQHLQNPPDCSSARKLLCNLNKGMSCPMSSLDNDDFLNFSDLQISIIFKTSWLNLNFNGISSHANIEIFKGACKLEF